MFCRIGIGCAAIAGLWGCTRAIAPAPPLPPEPPEAQAEASSLAPITYTTHEHPTSLVHVVTIPSGAGWQVGVAIADTLAPLPDLAAEVGAIAAINAGFFDPQNGLTTSYVTLNGALAADPRQNPRLIENPDLQAYLDAILNRSEFRIYDCGGSVEYAIAPHTAPVAPGCRLDAAVGAGPQLLPEMTGYAEGFLANNAAGEVVRDALGGRYGNARSAVGLKPDGTVVFVMAGQRLDAEGATGLSFDELADFLRSLGVTTALNLDGGSSSGLIYQGDAHYGRLNAERQPVLRPIKSILWVGDRRRQSD